MNQFIVHIKDGQITNRQIVGLAFRSLPDGAYSVKIKQKQKDRSLKQNAYYFSICVPMVREGLYELGYRNIKTNDQAHSIVKNLFLKRSHVIEETGLTIEEIPSTADLSTMQFNEYIENIIQWGAEYLGIQIPYPNEKLELNFGG